MSIALKVGLILALCWFLEKMLGTPMVIRPIVVSPLIGLVLGDLRDGLLIGATLELVFMGAIQIGGSIPPDVLVGAGLGTAFAIMNSSGADVALALALPISIVAQSLKMIVFIIRSYFMEPARKLAAADNIKGLQWLNISGLLLQCAMYFLVAFLAITLGSDAVQALIEHIPGPVMNGLQVAGGLLPAVGFALLLQPMMNKSNFLYFVLGFALYAYLNVSVIGITIFGIVVAFLMVYEKKDSNEDKKDDEGTGDLFDA